MSFSRGIFLGRGQKTDGGKREEDLHHCAFVHGWRKREKTAQKEVKGKKKAFLNLCEGGKSNKVPSLFSGQPSRIFLGGGEEKGCVYVQHAFFFFFFFGGVERRRRSP